MSMEPMANAMMNVAGKDAVKREFEDAYNECSSHWGSYWTEAQKDHEFYLGKQWTSEDKKYLADQRREALVFNKIRRLVQLITGYQRKNRLSLKVDAMESGDDESASQVSGVLQWCMNKNGGYEAMSDAFESSLKTGSALVRFYLDYTLGDPLSGDPRFLWIPYNRFALDPGTTKRDLSDCSYIIHREYLAKDFIKAILPPDARDVIDYIKKTSSDAKFPYGPKPGGAKDSRMFAYDEFWRRTWREGVVLIDATKGTMAEWQGDEERLRFLLQTSDPTTGRPLSESTKVVRQMRQSMRLSILVEGNTVWDDIEPTGIDDYPLVPILAFYDPEYTEDADYRLQGIVRCMRDPQTEVNKRRSKMLDILDSQIMSGWTAMEDSVVDEQALYVSGQGRVVFIKANAPLGLASVQKIPPADIPQGLFQLTEILDRDIMEIPGANSEIFGMPENDKAVEVAGVLAKMRQGAGLTILQSLFDNYRSSKKSLGSKLVKLCQKNFHPSKIERILGTPAVKQWKTGDFDRYDCVATEGVLTDTQRQMYYTQLAGMRQMGAPIPWSAMLKAAPMEQKKDLIEAVQAEEKSRAQAEQIQMQTASLNMNMLKAQIQAALSEIEKNRLKAQAAMQKEKRDDFKALHEIQQGYRTEAREDILAAAEISTANQQLLLDMLTSINEEQKKTEVSR